MKILHCKERAGQFLIINALASPYHMRQAISFAAQASSNRNKILQNTIGNNTQAPLSSLILSVVGGQRWYRGTVAGAWRYRLI